MLKRWSMVFMDGERIGRRLLEGSALAVIFAVPLFLWPWSDGAPEAAKQGLLSLLAFVSVLGAALVLFSGKSLRRQAWVWWIGMGGVVFATVVSALFSVGGSISWMGISLQEYTSVLTMILFLLAIGGASFSEDREAFLYRCAVSVVASSALTLGVFWFSFWFLGWVPFFSNGLNTVGSMHALGIVSVVGSVFAFRWIRRGRAESLALVWASRMTIVLSAWLWLSLDSWVLWTLVLAAAGMLLWKQIRFSRSHSLFKQIVLSVVTVFSVVFLIFPSPLSSPGAPEVVPGWKVSWDVVRYALPAEGWLTGSGPGTYLYDYARYRPENINVTALWDVRFDRATNHALTLLPTVGVLGVAAWVGFAALVAWRLLHALRRRRAEVSDAGAAWVLLLISMFLYHWNMTLVSLFVVLSLAVVLGGAESSGSRTFVCAPRSGRMAWCQLGLVLALVGATSVIFVTAVRVHAEGLFARTVTIRNAGGSIDAVIRELNRVTQVDGTNDMPFRNLAQALLFKVGEVTSSPDPNMTPSDQAVLIQSLVSASVNAAKHATDIAPYNVLNWRVRGAIYREVLPFVERASDFAALAYDRAILIEPSNPVNHAGRARVELTIAEAQEALLNSSDPAVAKETQARIREAIGRAQTSLDRAIELKEDYVPAQYYRAIVLDRIGDADGALLAMEIVREARPLDPNVAYSMGVLALKGGDLSLAQRELERAVSLLPTYANARWLLASIFETYGEVGPALAQVRAIADFNPDDARVSARLKRLEAGVLERDLAGVVAGESLSVDF